MKPFITTISAFAAAAFLAGSAMAAPAPEKKQTCCEAAKAKGEKCTHKCCISAAKEGKVCEKCNPPAKAGAKKN